MNLPVLKCVAATVIASTVVSAAWLASQVPGMAAGPELHLAEAAQVAQAERRLPVARAASAPSDGSLRAR